MKISLLSGADINAGDFLIVKRAHDLIERYVDNAEIKHYKRNASLEPYIDEINESDILIFAGGPGYIADMYPGRFPLVDDIDRIKPKMFSLGMGCYNRTSNISSLKFNDSTKKLIARLEEDGFSLGCRDVLAEQILKASGVQSTLMTGCPAWYDLDCLEEVNVIRPVPAASVAKIAISDPANVENYGVAKEVILQLRKMFPQAQIEFVFHRGLNNGIGKKEKSDLSQKGLRKWCQQNDVVIRSIEHSADGFRIYDEVDCHIGFRVHAHIYSLSHRRPTFLIEEDGRGFGVNETLDLRHFAAIRSFVPYVFWGFNKRFFHQSPIVGKSWRRSLAEEIVKYAIDEMQNEYLDLRNAFKKMRETHSVMVGQLKRINEQL